MPNLSLNYFKPLKMPTFIIPLMLSAFLLDRNEQLYM